MKIEFDENDLSYIEKINEALLNGEDFPMFIGIPGKRYFIEFTCENVAKANAFAMMFMNPNPDKIKELKDKLGITVNKISYVNPTSIQIDELKTALKKALKTLDE